ncbi:hypothetical protein H480_05919 [Amycolatopsis vancoresmycina DSM 44592]|uniref:Uncharacterized protein n=1 Tax=Amycolatopsis vancoresmycina DSM 44592 TaxID=1292037 RepID=R1IAI6_9PSEU|nr:hypothetical protein H480_05919 [Amycolatopsis vancoresmycina DSM 44592]
MPGLSAQGQAAIARLEHDRFHPGATAVALRVWAGFVRTPIHRLWDPRHGCGVAECCPDPEEVRALLHAVAHALPPKGARIFRARLAELDELW